IGYIREINILGHAIGQKSNPVKFDWLEKTIKPSMSDRAKSALTINRGNLGFTSHVGGREIDVWVPANKELLSIFEQLHPKKSEGIFFLRWGQSDGEGRLQFVEWFRNVLS
ncbi:VPA1262 family N-terminal domain-containing protein, partial [Salmonella enterica]|uniref:VPA1262 family N-terminal domain-containing protein n=1 Tax=Salmonella enterica TaxID=28901 RepID=UPI0021B37A3D